MNRNKRKDRASGVSYKADISGDKAKKWRDKGGSMSDKAAMASDKKGSGIKRILYKVLGLLSLSLGILGIFLPLLPTTPFLLLASYFFVSSSPMLHRWLLNHRILGEYIRDFQEQRAIPLRVKICSIILLWTTISFSAFFIIDALWLRLLLMGIAIGVSIHILKFKTKGK